MDIVCPQFYMYCFWKLNISPNSYSTIVITYVSRAMIIGFIGCSTVHINEIIQVNQMPSLVAYSYLADAYVEPNIFFIVFLVWV